MHTPGRGWTDIADLQALIDHMPIMLALLDREERYRVVSAEYARRVGKSVDEVIGGRVRDVVGHEAYDNAIGERVKACLALGEPVEYQLELWGDAAGRVIKVNYFPQHGEDGQVDGLLMLGTDITDHVQAPSSPPAVQPGARTRGALPPARWRDLAAVRSSLVEQERLTALGRASAMVSHELRNPLGTIAVNLQTLELALERGHSPAPYLARIRRNLGRCDHVISRMMDYNKPFTIDARPGDFDRWLESLIDETPNPNRIALRWRPGDTGLIRFDSEMMQRAIGNLVENAMQAIDDQHGESGGGELSLSTDRQRDEVQLRIVDNGTGMDESTLDRLFEPFFSTRVYGVGIGTAIARNVIEGHGGRLRVRSAPGTGTQVQITLPA